MSLPASLFVSSTVHPREIKLEDGTTATVYFKELPAIKFAAYHEARTSPDPDTRDGSIAKLVAASLCGEDGSPVVTYEQALMLKPGPTNEIMTHILSVNGYSGQKKA